LSDLQISHQSDGIFGVTPENKHIFFSFVFWLQSVQNKIGMADMTYDPAKYIDAPIMDECILSLECKVESILEYGKYTNFVASARYGENLICRCAQTEDNVCIHSIVRSDGTEVFRARSEWADEQNLSRELKIR